MKRIVVTGTFTGCIYLAYKANGYICLLDTTEAELNPEQLRYILRNIPVMIEDLTSFIRSAKMNAVEQVEEVTFEMFYKEYE